MTIFENTKGDSNMFVRLGLGQCNLKSQLHLVRKHPTAVCGCGVSDTVENNHFECFRYLVQRAKHLRDVVDLQIIP